jgi:hypothetical protein
MLRSAGSLLEDARARIERGETRVALRDLRRARRMFRRTESRSGLAAVLSLTQAIEPGEERSERGRERLISAIDADLRRLDARGAPESVEKTRSRYLRRDSKRRPPSPRALRITYFVGIAAIVILVALAIAVIVLGSDLPCQRLCAP